MSDTTFDLTQAYRAGLPAPAPVWKGLPKYPFASGHNAREGIPAEALAAAAAAVLARDGRDLAVYNMGTGPLGYPALRDVVVQKLGLTRATAITPDEVLITSGSSQGIDLVNRLLIERGDVLLFEEYSFAGAMRKVGPLGGKAMGIPLDAQGIDVDALEAKLVALAAEGLRPKYLYTIPTIQNPTGSILPLERRLRIVDLARQYRFVIFEDECYADILWEGEEAPASFYALAPDVTLHIGSFSKSLAPALRLGYLVARPEVLRQILPMKTDLGTASIDQMVLAEYFSTGFTRHMAELTPLLRAKYDLMVEAVDREFGTTAEMWKPKGGIFLWLKLPDQVDSREIVAAAARRGVAFNPGPEWAVEGETAKSWLRICFALPTETEIVEGVRALAEACHEVYGLPAVSANRQNG